MSRALNLIPVTTMASEEHWKRFTVLARSQGQTISALLRLLVARELQRAAKNTLKTQDA
jgi:hypothetical protein